MMQTTIDFRRLAMEAFGIELTDSDVEAIEGATIGVPNNGPWCCLRPDSGEGWVCWLKSRLVEFGIIEAGKKGVIEPKLFTVLHIFVNKVLPGDGCREYWPSPARSDIITGILIPRPIDRVAHRVAPGMDEQALWEFMVKED
jgi:hypothetical protein